LFETWRMPGDAVSTPKAAIFCRPSQRAASALIPGPLNQSAVPKARR